MMWSLFLNRLKKDWHYQTSILRSVIDWTVIVYFILPVLFFGGVFYRSLWITRQEWFEWIYWTGWILFLFLLALTKKWRTYLYEADTVFLLKRPEWVLDILKVSFYYNVGASIVFSGMAVFLFLPYLIGILDASIGQCLLVLLLLAIIRSLCKVLMYWIFMRYSGFKKFLMVSGWLIVQILTSSVAVAGVIYSPWATLVFGAGLFLLLRFIFIQTLITPKWLSYHGAQEAIWKVRFIRTIFALSKEIDTPPSTKKSKRPKLFRKSRIIRSMKPTAGMLELFLKHHVRNRTYLYRYFQLFGVTMLSAALVPAGWLFIVIVAVLCFICMTIHGTMWDLLIEKHSLGVKYRFHDSYLKAKNWTLVGMMSPIIVLAIVFMIR